METDTGYVVGGGYLPQLVFGRPLKLWWRPLNSSGDMTLLVRAQRVGSAADTIRYETGESIAPLDSDTHEPVAEEAAFPPGIEISAPGKWLMVATSGRNWGCLVVTVRAADG